MRISLTFYVLVVAVFGFLVWLVLTQGTKLETNGLSATDSSNGVVATPAVGLASEGNDLSGILGAVKSGLEANVRQPLSLLLLQIAVIVVVSRLLGFLVSKLGQPQVIGEIIAGIFLGPSLLGLFWPRLSGFLFQADSLPALQIFSQIGLLLFMFIVGLELDLRLLKRRAHAAVIVSHASIIFPFFLGVGLAYFLYEVLAPPGISFIAFGLFMGIAMSITAFPVLARIIHERGLTQTPLGVLAITCAAADDVTAWCILAAVIAIVQAGSAASAVFTIALSSLYVVIMLNLVRPALQRLGADGPSATGLNRTFVVVAFAVLFLSAFATEVIGIHALFGAFLAGVSMSDLAGFKKLLAARIEDISVILLLPLFFAFTGLKTQIGLLNTGYGWLICALIILMAVVGKFGGSFVAARVTGQSLPDSLALGALMNTRGLMELIVLNIGYDLGVLSPLVFTMLVLMALVTTMMTSPALSVIQHLRQQRAPLQAKVAPEGL